MKASEYAKMLMVNNDVETVAIELFKELHDITAYRGNSDLAFLGACTEFSQKWNAINRRHDTHYDFNTIFAKYGGDHFKRFTKIMANTMTQSAKKRLKSRMR